jgi:hypothetical protein
VQGGLSAGLAVTNWVLRSHTWKAAWQVWLSQLSCTCREHNGANHAAALSRPADQAAIQR